MYVNFLKLGMAILILLIIDFASEIILSKKVKDKRKSIKYRVALRYVLFFCLLFTIAKIWVDGFGYLLGIIGVVAAALTITQKEYLMNLFGWLIIMWRDVFSEGDYIEIGRFSGYVRYMGPFYFLMEELFEGDKTGRFIKIPNSMVATQPLINYTIDRSFIEGRQYFIFSFASHVSKIQQLMLDIESELEKFLYQLNEDRTPRQQREFHHQKTHCQCILRVMQEREKAVGLQLKVRYYSLKQDQKKVNDQILAMVMLAVDQNDELLLSEAV